VGSRRGPPPARPVGGGGGAPPVPERGGLAGKRRRAPWDPTPQPPSSPLPPTAAFPRGIPAPEPLEHATARPPQVWVAQLAGSPPPRSPKATAAHRWAPFPSFAPSPPRDPRPWARPCPAAPDRAGGPAGQASARVVPPCGSVPLVPTYSNAQPAVPPSAPDKLCLPRKPRLRQGPDDYHVLAPGTPPPFATLVCPARVG